MTMVLGPDKKAQAAAEKRRQAEADGAAGPEPVPAAPEPVPAAPAEPVSDAATEPADTPDA
jgi:hypothetical protein